ncbi:MFS transporter [Anaerorhabdus furcosa]|uniref:MFS transporter, DHA3 family, macrolide efflux protein n=1 Tax=Anaerorhabdus furcosa TaxID=118967 RepID=A0A1T4KCI4_9FIRM|nr:MFS transporter [Anaerorhabdus furcosa]SJZ40043.1 MFS transporter, DHA3 family, macrolide efflux protein [Anaerorhabdus furcosa]
MENNWKNNTVRFLSAQTISLFGSSLVQYAIVWYVTLSTSSGLMLTISTICGFLPQICVSLFAGSWIDKYDRKKLIMLSDSMIACATLFLALLFLSGNKNIWVLFIVLMIRSAGTGLQTPAVNAILPQIVPQENLMKVNGILSTCNSIMMFLSPAISGAILSVFSLEVTLFIDVITAIIGVSITSTVKVKKLIDQLSNEKTMIQNMKEGFSYVKNNKFILNLLIFQMVSMFMISPSAFLTPLMIARRFGDEVWRLTASEMTYSLGMVLGGILITTWGGFKNRLNTTLLAGTLYGVFMISLGASPWFLLYLIFNTCIGLVSPCYNTPITVSIQERVEQNMQGRVFSFMQITTSCMLPLGMMFYGPLADIIPVEVILVVAGILVICSAGIFHFSKALKN